MFQYEFEKRPPSAGSCDSRATMSADWSRAGPSASRVVPSASRVVPSASRVQPNAERARRPLPPRPIVCDRLPAKNTVPLRVWVVSLASCLGVCAALVLATLAVTRWTSDTSYSTRELISEPIYAKPPHPIDPQPEPSSEELDNDLDNIAILEKLSLFKSMVSNRNKDLLNKPQPHPLHDPIHHPERKIEKKDKPKPPDTFPPISIDGNEIYEPSKIHSDSNKIGREFTLKLPEFKPILPNIMTQMNLPENYMNNLNNKDYEEYYNDENLYDDYMQSNTMTSYLIEKVQELHDWITKDPDFDKTNTTRSNKDNLHTVNTKTEFNQLLRALNDSLLEGNVSIVMNKLRDIYFGDNFTSGNTSRRVILTNSTDLLSFGILTLDVMLLHNIQLMAWESQESARTKMLKDPNVFAFTALFMEPSRVEAARNELHNVHAKRQNMRQESAEFDLGKNLFENVLEVGMSAARAAIHLGRAYKNARNIVSQLSSREPVNIQPQITRRLDDNTHALQHLQTSFDSESSSATEDAAYSELDCVWLLYCRNLVVTAKLNPPFGTMARINGVALRMVSGAVAAGRALDVLLYEVVAGWSDLHCDTMFPRCSKADAASVVMDSILRPSRNNPTEDDQLPSH